MFNSIKIQPNKENGKGEDVIEKIPQSQARKVDFSKPYHSEKDFSFPKTVLSNQKGSCQHESFKIYPWLD